MGWVSKKKKTIISFLVIFALTFALGAVLGGQFKNYFTESVQNREAQGKIINVLLLGIDARDAKSNSRSDTIILASIDSKSKRVAMLSIPRDTRIKNTFGRSEKINGVNYTKGPEAACKEVGKLLNTQVDYYVVTNFAGFDEIIDTLGGVDIDVETNMVHTDVSYSINLAKGYQHLNGDKALQYVRYRGGPTADIGRTQRQQKFIKALAKQMFKAKTILKLPQLLPQISKNINTNIPMSDMIYMAEMAQKIDTSKITSQTLPGYPYTDPGSGASYWEADKDKAEILISALLLGKTFPVVGDPPGWIQKEQDKYRAVDLPTPETLQEQDEKPAEESESGGDDIETLPGSLPAQGDSGLDPGSIAPEVQAPADINPPDQLPPGDNDTPIDNGINNDNIQTL